MAQFSQEVSLLKAIRRKITIVILFVLLLAIPSTRGIVTTFLFAFFLGGCFQKPILFLEKRHIPRWLSSVLILFFLLAPVSLLLGYGFIALLQSLQTLLSSLLQTLAQPIHPEDWFYPFLTALPPQAQQTIQTLVDQLKSQSGEILRSVLTQLGTISSGVVMALPSAITSCGLFLLFLFFCCMGYTELYLLLMQVLPPDWRRQLEQFQREAYKRLASWGKAQLTLSGILWLELTLGLLMLRINHAPFLAGVVVMVDVIPMIGSGLVLIPWSGALYLMHQPVKSLGIFLLWLVAWATRAFLEPKLVGIHLHLPTCLSLLSALIGVKLWGFKGLILFPVLTAVLLSYLPKESNNSLHQ